jgi:CII-binding regulator of phage lambda lysogenization HflD
MSEYTGDDKIGQFSAATDTDQLLLRVWKCVAASAAAIPPGGLATEATLNTLLNNLIASQDVEILLVRDTGNGDQVVQQIREYDEGTGVWNTRYEDVNGAAYVVVGPLVYIDPSGVLNLILTELQSLNLVDFATETTLAALSAKLNSLGQKASAASMPVVLSTEQEAMIDGLETLLTSIDGKDFSTETTLLATNALLTTIDTVLDAIKVDTGSIAAEDFATETTLAALSAKFNSLGQKLSAASVPVVLSTEQEALIDGIETLLTSLDGKDYSTETTLAALNTKLNSLGQKVSASSAPVVLSTEQEVILNAIKTAVEALDLDADGLATEVTLAALNAKFGTLGQKASAGSAPVVLSTEQEALIDGIEALLTTIDADTSNLDVLLSTRATEATLLIIDSVLDNILLDTAAIQTAVEAIETNTTPGTTSVVTAVAFGALSSSATLKALNTSRKRLIITNDTDAILYVKEGATASPTDYTWKVGVDEAVVIEGYTGIVDGILAGGATTGNVLVTETT